MPADEWINKVWSVRTVESRSAMKQKEALKHVTIRMNLGSLLLSERSHSQRAMYDKFHSCERSEIGKSIETQSRLLVSRGWGVIAKGYRISFRDENILEFDSGDDGTTLNILKNL